MCVGVCSQNGFTGTKGKAAWGLPANCNEPHRNLSNGSSSSHGMWGGVGSGVGAEGRAMRGHKAKERGWWKGWQAGEN